MSTLESITVSLEVARQLKAAGWPQSDDTLMVWQENKDCSLFSHPIFGKPQVFGSRWIYLEPGCGCSKFAAPTAEEILRRLPQFIEEPPIWKNGIGRTGKLCALPNTNKMDEWIVAYADNNSRLTAQVGDTLANAAAAMFCYLKANNLLP